MRQGRRPSVAYQHKTFGVQAGHVRGSPSRSAWPPSSACAASGSPYLVGLAEADVLRLPQAEEPEIDGSQGSAASQSASAVLWRTAARSPTAGGLAQVLQAARPTATANRCLSVAPRSARSL